MKMPNILSSYVPDQTCKFKTYLTNEDGSRCLKPCCLIGHFECQFILDTNPCPIKWQFDNFDGWDTIDDETKIRIVDNASTVVKTLANSHSIEIPQVTTLFDLLDATRIVQKNIEGPTAETTNTLESIAATLIKLGTSTKSLSA